MAESSTTHDKKIYRNDFSAYIFQKIMESEAPDVHFTFEVEGKSEAEKIPAHKKILVAASPVFDAMFNGELKEKGDVKIVDASPDAFREFLQFFYNNEVNLRMENIADVLNLAHKYDVTAGLQAAIEFLEERLTSEEMIWGLHLAVKYQLKELKAFCKKQILNDPVNKLDVFEPVEGNEPVFTTESKLVAENSLQNTLTEVLLVTKEIISNQSAELGSFRSKCILPYVLSARGPFVLSKVDIFTMTFYLDKSVFLADIFLAEVYEYACNFQCKEMPFKGTVYVIETSPKKFLFENQFEIGNDTIEKRIKMPKLILISPNKHYSIVVKPSVSGVIPSKILENRPPLAKGINLSFVHKPEYTLIDRLHFVALP